MENFEAINKHGSVFLTKITEPKANQLLLEVKKSKVSNFEVDVYVGDSLLSGCKEITIDQTETFFTILFTEYISYHVINESYANSNPLDQYIAGDYGTFCVFQKSNYMHFIQNETFAEEMFPSELKHYGLFAADHIVHVISKYEPKITLQESLT